MKKKTSNPLFIIFFSLLFLGLILFSILQQKDSYVTYINPQSKDTFSSSLYISIGAIVLIIALVIFLIKRSKIKREELPPQSEIAQKESPTISCPACKKEISRQALACPSCGHPINSKRQWSPGIATLLSFIIPGAGQMYKGKVLAGLIWFCAVVVGYFLLIIPGIMLHLACILFAATGPAAE